jgi:two-component system OmpR family response regulator
VLLVEDEVKLAALLERGLVEEGYAVDVASTASDGSWHATENTYDAIILDVMLPDGNGFELCHSLRVQGCWSPILMLTARDDVTDRVTGLDAGADDYLTKPFAFDELLARLRALMRRVIAERPTVLHVDGLRLDPASRKVRRGDDPVALTAKEFALLEYFMRNPNRVLSRSELVEHVWDFAFESDSNVVDVYVRYLREKIDRPFGTESIETIRGVGYRLRGEHADAATHQG